jgi:hypothetical protein
MAERGKVQSMKKWDLTTQNAQGSDRKRFGFG